MLLLEDSDHSGVAREGGGGRQGGGTYVSRRRDKEAPR